MKKLMFLLISLSLLIALPAFAGQIEVSQAKLQAVQAEWTYLNNLIGNIQQRQQVLQYQARDLQAEIKKLVDAKKAVAVEEKDKSK